MHVTGRMEKLILFYTEKHFMPTKEGFGPQPTLWISSNKIHHGKKGADFQIFQRSHFLELVPRCVLWSKCTFYTHNQEN